MVETQNLWLKVKDILYSSSRMCSLLETNWSVEMMWFPFNSISAWESFAGFMVRQVNYGDWDPGEDEVWVRLINKPSSYQVSHLGSQLLPNPVPIMSINFGKHLLSNQ